MNPADDTPPSTGPAPSAAQPPPREVPALRLDGPELALLLSLRSTPAAGISRQGLGITAEAGPAGRESLAQRGLWRERQGLGLPAGQAIAVGDTLTSAVCWLRMGTDQTVAASIVVGPEHTLLLAALGAGAQEIAALQVDADVAQVAADICAHLAAGPRIDPGLHVHVLSIDPTGTVHEQIIPAGGDEAADPDLATRLRLALPQGVAA